MIQKDDLNVNKKGAASREAQKGGAQNIRLISSQGKK